ncbi:M20 family metallopeptidase [Bosea lathyri]|uniref:Aminobenzoyl-glutamate utilization protein B n=1 Tax=Bosea lathyri TaxID=1036778 RepID=A0A1H6DA31_9HYPH|nr:M20 family metallopeptidase [Bosea lathyri]SEG82068.1 aminobenzoyl-glutamate utilization protein B [Bosea lathyri]
MADAPNSDEIWKFVESKKQKYFDLSDEIWATPELNFEEYRSSAVQPAALEVEGFDVQRGVAGLPTAIMATAGSEGPIIAFLGEFDALPDHSQEAGIAEHAPTTQGAPGHACGHNLLGVGSIQAAVALKDYLEKEGLPGRVRYYGCPAEEGGSGKGYMARAGLFDDVDAAITWHPSSFVGVGNPITLSCNEINFNFVGKSSHAASSPHLGRSALDAVELMNVGVNYMREHMPSRARIHYAVTDTGGHAPNVVQARATVRYVVRGGDPVELKSLVARVMKIAEAAAMMTETSVSHRVLTGEASMLGNETLEHALFGQIERLGPPQFSEEDRAFAQKIQETFSTADVKAAYANVGLKPKVDVSLADELVPPRNTTPTMVGSTDVGNVSWIVPTVEMRGATHAIGTPGHSWQITAQGKSPAAHKGMEHAAKAMACTGLELIQDGELRRRVQEEHRRLLEETPFLDPIPDDAFPDLPAHRAK